MQLLTHIKDNIDDLLGLVYPRLCLSCQRPLVKHEELMCLLCKYDLPETNYHLDPENPVFRHFWGRVRMEHGAALYLFTSGSRVQHLLHALKYKNRPEVGVMLGHYYGTLLSQTAPFSQVDVIVPVPLHKKKEHLRGYNQSAKFATGLSATMQAKASNNALQRIAFTGTQTKKSRLERWENVKRVFEVQYPLAIKGKKVLLVDDVVTTGSTLEACAHQLLTTGAASVCVATIACASHF